MTEQGGDQQTENADAYAPEPNSAIIEPQSLSVEHALWVLLGAMAMILVIVRIVLITVSG